MRRRVLDVVQSTDFLEDVKPEELAKDAKLGWLKRIIIIAIWPLIKPFIAKKIGDRLTEVLEEFIDEI